MSRAALLYTPARMSIRYWRFVHHEHGAICGPCAWVVAYERDPAEPLEVDEPKSYRCERCRMVVMPVASRSLDTAPTTL